MKSFHGDEKIKEKYVSRVMAHQAADNLVKGIGWEKGKGCAVGCTLENYDHAQYEKELGIPEWLARVEDALFEGMSKKKSQTWPEKFLKAIPIGIELGPVKNKFLVIILSHTLESMDACKYDKKKNPEVKKAIDQSKAAVKKMIRCLEGNQDTNAARSAESAARSAARSAANAARSAESAARSAARSAASSAASAASSAASAASSAASAAWSAESAAWSAERSAESAAWSAAYDYYADQLLKLLENCK